MTFFGHAIRQFLLFLVKVVAVGVHAGNEGVFPAAVIAGAEKAVGVVTEVHHLDTVLMLELMLLTLLLLLLLL